MSGNSALSLFRPPSLPSALPPPSSPRFFPRTSDFIDDAVGGGGTVAVNCVMGWSRSATVVAAYLVSKRGMSVSEALEHLRARRPIRPNPGFLQQLADYDSGRRKRRTGWRNGI